MPVWMLDLVVVDKDDNEVLRIPVLPLVFGLMLLSMLGAMMSMR